MKRQIFLFFIFLSTLSLAQTTYYSRSSGNWADPNTWSTVGCGVVGNTGTYPTVGDIAYVCHNVLINVNVVTQHVVVNNTGILEFDNVGVRTLTMTGDLTVNPGGVFRYQSNSTLAHDVVIGGNFNNSGTIDFFYDNNDYVGLTFNGSVSASVTGTGAFDLYNVTINKSSKITLVSVNTANFYSNFNNGSWTLTQGTYYMNNNATHNISATSNYTINQNSTVRVDANGTINFCASASLLTLQGRLELMNGVINIGSTNGAAPNGLRYEVLSGITPELIVHSGTVNIFQGITYKTSTTDPFIFSMYGGTLNLNLGSTVSNTETFRVNDVASSFFFMNGGAIQYHKTNSASQSDLNVCGAAGNVTATSGTVIFGNTSTPNNAVFNFTPYPNSVLPNLRVSGAAANTTTLKPFNSNSFKLNSLFIEANKYFDVSHNASGGDLRTVTFTGTYDGTHSFWDDNATAADHFLFRNSTVNFEGSSTIKVNGMDTYQPRFYNVNLAYPGQTTTLEETMGVMNNVGLQGGTFTSLSWQQLYVHGGSPFTFVAGSVISVESVKFFKSNSAQSITAWDYNTKLVMAGDNNSYSLSGNTSCNYLFVNGDFKTNRTNTFYNGNNQLTIRNDLEIGTAGGSGSLKKFYSTTGSIIVQGNVRIYEDAEFYGETATISVYGNWTNTALPVVDRGFNEANSTVNFQSTGATLSCTNGPESFYNLGVAKTAGNALTLASPITVSHHCHFASGKIVSSSTNHVTFLNGTTHDAAGNGSGSSFVEGPMRYYGFNTLIFPVGKNARYRPVTIYASVGGASSDLHRVEYFDTSPDPTYPVSQKDGVLSSVSTCEYWSVQREAGSSTGHIRLTFNSTGSCNTASYTSFSIARWSGSQWNKIGGTGGAGRTGSSALGSEESCINTPFNHVFTHTVETAPTISPSGTVNICVGGSITLTASTGGSYSWSTGETTPTITVSNGGSYTVTVGPCGATSAATTVTVSGTLPPDPTASNTSICSGTTATLAASGSTNYNWYNASSGGVLLGSGTTYTTTTLSSTTTYYVASYNGSCESLNRTPLTVNVYPKPSLSTNVSNVYSCGDAKLIAYTNGLGNCVSMDGTDDYMAVPAGIYFTGDYTIEAWIRPRAFNNWSRIIDFGNGAPDNNIILAISNGTSGRPALSTYKGTLNRVITAPSIEALTLNQWVHIAATVKDSTGSLYINGKLVSTGLIHPAQGVVLNSNLLGRSNWATDGYSNADIDELRIWNVARTQPQISAGMEISYPTGTSNIVSYLRMNEGTGVITDDDVGPLSTQLWGGATWNTYGAPLDLTYSWSPATGLNTTLGRQVAAGPGSTTTYTVTATYSTGCSNSASITVNPTIPGDTSVFGNNTWNVYAFRTLYQTNYAGYYTNATLNYNSQAHFNDLLSPSFAAGYQGCDVPGDNFSIRAKRTNFTPGYYQINVVENDDSCSLLVNNRLWLSRNFSATSVVAWTGRLDATSKVDFRFNDQQVNARGNITIISIAQPTLNPGSIGSDQSFCLSGDPALLTSGAAATGCSITGYQWQDSTASGAWANINGAVSLTYDPPTTTQTRWYRRKVSDECGATAYSNLVKVQINAPTGDTAVYGNNTWNVYAFATKTFTSYQGYYTSSSLNFNSSLDWNDTGSPSEATSYIGCPVINNDFSFRAKRTNFTPGYYRIDVAHNDDDCNLLVNERLWFSRPRTITTATAWIGMLDAASRIEFNLNEYTSVAKGIFTFTAIAKPTLDPGTISNDQSFCLSGNPVLLTSGLAASGCSISGYQWQDSIAGGTWNSIAGATALTYDPPSISQTTWYRRRVINECRDTAYTNIVRAEIIVPAGDTSVFGNSIWNVYAFNATNFTSYYGYYTDATTNMISGNKWNNTLSPSAAPGYVGCAVGIDNFSLIAKRRNFPAGYYSLYIENDDSLYLYVDGKLKASLNTSGGAYRWTGYLDASSTVEVRLIEFAGNSVLNLTFTGVPKPPLDPGTISSDQSFCFSGNPSPFVSVNPASGCSSIQYQWQDSISSGTWTTISGAINATYDAGLLTQSRWYRRRAVSDCRDTAYSNVLTVLVENPLAPSVNGIDVFCGPSATTLTATTSEPIVKWYDAPTGGTILFTGNPYVTALVSTSTSFYAVATTIAGCESPRTLKTVTINPLPDVTVSNVCGGEFLVANVSSATNSLKFDGVNDNATITPISGIGGTFTIEAWVYLNSYTSGATLLDIGNGTANDNITIKLSEGISGKPSAYIYQGASSRSVITQVTPIPLMQWTHIAYVQSGVVGGFFINGQMSGQSNAMWSPVNLARTVNSIGSNNAGSGNLDGQVDLLRIWSVARTQGQIRTDMTNELPSVSTGLLNNFTFNEGSGTTSTDITSSATATLQNGTMWTAKAAPIGLSFQWTPSATLLSDNEWKVRPLSTIAQTYKVVVTNTDGGCKDSATASNTIAPGDTSLFGNNSWDVYSFDGATFNSYYGNFPITPLSFDTRTYFPQVTSPSFAAGYVGCQVGEEFSFRAKRKNFQNGLYTIDIQGLDDKLEILVDSVSVFNHTGCCVSLPGAWSGFLNQNSSVEIRLQDFLRNGFLDVLFNFTPYPISSGTISGNQIICFGATPAPLTETVAASGCGMLTYEWQDSISGGTWQTVASTLGYSPTAPLEDTWIRRIVRDECQAADTSNVVHITVVNPGIPAVSDVSICAGYTAVFNATGSAGSYSWYSVPSGGSALYSGNPYSVLATVSDTVYVEATFSTCKSIRTLVKLNVGGAAPDVSFTKDLCSTDRIIPTLNGFSNAVNFDGVDDYAQVPSGVYFNGDFTVESWVKLDQFPIWQRLIDFGNGYASDNVFITFNGDNDQNIELHVFNGGQESVLKSKSGISPYLKNWFHLACVVQGNVGYIYINGELSNTGAILSPLNVVRNSNFIARSNFSAPEYTDGMIDELRIWNVARSQAQLQTSMYFPVPVNVPGLQNYWNFDEASGATLTDLTSGADATLMNGSLRTIGVGAPLGFTYSWSPIADLSSTTTLFTKASPSASSTYQVVVDNGGCKDSASVVINLPQGDTSIYGTTDWRVYTFDGFNYDAYHGYYSEPLLNYNSQEITTGYDQFTQPSAAPGYVGCPVEHEYHSTMIRRTSFTDTIYQINIIDHDDFIFVRKDNDTIFGHRSCCDTHDSIWVGRLGANTKLDFQLRNGFGKTHLNFEVIMVLPPVNDGGIISASQVLCVNQVGDTLRNVLDAKGCSNLRYEWEYSLDSTAWVLVTDSIKKYLLPGAITQTTWFRRAAIDDCKNRKYSNVVKMKVDSPTPPIALDRTVCSTPTTITLLASGADNYRWYDSVGGGVLLDSDSAFTVSILGDTIFYLAAVSDQFSCEGIRVPVQVQLSAAAPGDTSLFGNAEWLAFVFEGNNFDSYRGFYSDNSVNILTTNQWDQMSAPSDAANYQGCAIPVDNFSIRFKRQGFIAGLYKIEVPDHNEGFSLYINDEFIYQYSGSNGAHYPVWQGTLDATSKIEFRLSEITLAAYLKADFITIGIPPQTPRAGLINSDRQFCANSSALTITDGRSINVHKDAYVDDQNSSVNYGTSPTMEVRTVSSSNYRYTYLTYDLGSAPENVSVAKVKIFGNTNGSQGNSLIGIYAITDTAWSESGLTYSNRPVPGVVLDTVRFNQLGSWITLDVTAHVANAVATGKRYVSFMLQVQNSSNNVVNVISKEGAYASQLLINKSYSSCRIHYEWIQSAGCNTMWSTIAGADTAIYSVPALTQTTCFRKVIHDECGRKDSSNVVTIQIDSLSVSGIIAGTTPVCENTNTGTLAVTGVRGSFINWQVSTDNINFISLPVAVVNDSLSFNNIEDTTWYKVITKNASCPADTSIAYQVSTLPPSEAGTVIKDTSVCSGGTATLQLTGNNGLVVGWEKSVDNFSTSSPISNTTTTNVEAVTVATKFRAIVQNGTCPVDTSSTAEVTIVQPPVGTISTEQRVIKGMNSGWIHISAFVDPLVRWEFSYDNFQTLNTISSTNDSINFANLVDSVWYRVIMQSPACGETVSDVAPVWVYNPMLFTVPDTIEIYRDQLFISPLSLLDRVSYKDVYIVSTQTGNTLSSKGGLFQIDTAGMFSYRPPSGYLGVDSVNFNTCTNDLTMPYCETQPVYFRMVELPAKPEPGPITVYTSFSPNGDGTNDEWIIENIQFFPDNAVRILDRWGKMVFEQEGYNNSGNVWKGEANAGKKDLPEDTYYYILEIDKKIAKTGFVVLKR